MIAKSVLWLLLGGALLLPALADEEAADDTAFGGDAGGDSPLGESGQQAPPDDEDADERVTPSPPVGERPPSGDDFSPTEQLRFDQEVDYPVDI